MGSNPPIPKQFLIGCPFQGSYWIRMTTYRAIILHPFDVTFQAAAVAVALPHAANWFDHIATTKLYR